MNNSIMLQTILFSISLGAIGLVLSDKFKFPGIIIYLGFGVIFGNNVFGLIQPNSLGEGVNVIINIFVSLILFEGGFSLNFNQFMKMKTVLIKDILFSIFFVMGSAFLVTFYFLGLEWEIALLFSSLIIVTGPTVVKPIIRHIPLKNNIKEFLNSEAVIVDAVGALITILLLEFVLYKHQFSHVILNFALSVGVGFFSGIVAGILLKYLLTKTKLFPETTHSFLVLAFVFLDFWVSETISPESGLISVMVVGIVLSRIEYKTQKHILEFIEKITRIIIAFLFVLLSANFNFNHISNFITSGIAVIVTIILSRFFLIFASTQGQSFSLREKVFLSWVGPRGIIAMAVASIISLKLKSKGFENSYLIEILVFLLIVTTVIIQGLSAKLVAKKLDIFERGERNIIILGINNLTLNIAEILKSNSEILFVDSNKDNCIKAKNLGFQYRMGNAFDENIYENLDLLEYSTVLSATENNEINVLYCRFLKNNYGFSNLYATLKEKESVELSQIVKNDSIRLAFGVNDFRSLFHASYFQKAKDYVTSNHKNTFKTIVNDFKFIKNQVLPENCIILLVKRKGGEFYIYHTEFTFEMNDEIFFIANAKDALSIRNFFYNVISLSDNNAL